MIVVIEEWLEKEGELGGSNNCKNVGKEKKLRSRVWFW
jgi:hypothetical protein